MTYYPPRQIPVQNLESYRHQAMRNYQQDQEKNRIRRCANSIGLTLIINRVFYLLLSLFSGILLLMLGFIEIDFAGQIQEMDLIGSTLVSMLIYSVCLFVPFFIFLKLRKESFNRVFPFEKVGGKNCALLVVAGIGICMGVNFQTSLMLTAGEMVGIHFPLPESPYENSLAYVLVSAGGTALLPALLEEFVFRGAILGSLRRFGDSFAVIVSAVLFSLSHFYLPQLPLALMVGLAMGFVVVKTNSLLPVLFIHFFNNLFSVLMEALSYNIDQLSYLLVYFGAVALLIAGGILAVFALAKSGFITFPARGKFALPLKKRVGAFCSSGGMICIFILLGFCIILGTAGIL